MEEEFIWTTKEGKEIPLSEIGDQHLRNIARMMRREISAAWRISGILQGEMAPIAADSDIDGMEEDYSIILREINRRKEVKNGARGDSSDT